MVKNLPALGFNTWNTFGENINEQLVRDTADAMAATGWCPVMKSSPPA